MSWINPDGLYIKFAKEEADSAQGGEFNSVDGIHTYEFKIDYSEIASATAAIINGGDTTKGPYGVVIPEGLRIQEVETFVQTAFGVSAGSVSTAQIVIGLFTRDRSSTLDIDALTSTAATGSVLGLATVGAKTVISGGSTGFGSSVGTTLAQDGIVVAANARHGTDTFNAGVLIVRVRGYFP